MGTPMKTLVEELEVLTEKMKVGRMKVHRAGKGRKAPKWRRRTAKKMKRA